MSPTKFFRCSLLLVPPIWLAVATAAGAACVWKVTAPTGAVLYLGGSYHALRSIDYPLPPAYNRAFDASARLAFETDEKADVQVIQSLRKAGEYARGDNLKNHIDPRSYQYLKRLYGLMGVSEDKFARYRPWYLALITGIPGPDKFYYDLGVESFLTKRARANSKPITGLETGREHAEVLSGLTDRQGEVLLLTTFLRQEESMSAWRRGDADAITRTQYAAYRDFPSVAVRLLDARNRNWIPKIEGYLRSSHTYFVVVGAAHMGGRSGVISLLKARGYKVEQF